MRHRTAKDRGIVALITVIIIGALVVLIGVSASYMAQTEIVLSGQAARGRHALALATACAEEALFRVKLDTAYTGGTIPLDDDTCTAVVSGSGTTRTITASAASGEHTKTVQIGATLLQNASAQARAWRVDSWTEVDP